MAELLVAQLRRAHLKTTIADLRGAKDLLDINSGVVDSEVGEFNTTTNKILSTETQNCDYFASELYVTRSRYLSCNFIEVFYGTNRGARLMSNG